MEVAAGEIKQGQVFYGLKMVGEWHEFEKFTANKVSPKQIKGNDHYKDGRLGYEKTLRACDWRFFTDFESARGLWISVKLERDIKQAENVLERLHAKREELLSKTDL